MTDFNFWKKLYDDGSISEFHSDPHGILWLKVKSITRRELIDEFIKSNNIILSEISLTKQFSELFTILSKDIATSNKNLDAYIIQKNTQQILNINRKQLVSELYKLNKFEWGGDYQNALDKYLISEYVKKLHSYDTLLSKFDTEIKAAVQGYVLNSWYNHWTSILIENIFKSHTKVLPTVGQIKSVDFFINGIPFDLKVTYLPVEYIAQQRKIKGYPVELTYLKSKAKEAKIDFDKTARPSQIAYEITEKMQDKNDSFCTAVLSKLKSEKLDILNDAIKNPAILSKWLYENQGEMRFGSENRLFLVLVDTNDFSNSWKLKRNLDLLEPMINKSLDKFSYDIKNYKSLSISYNFPKNSTKTYSSLADIIFVVK